MGYLSPAHINITILDNNSADSNEETLEERIKRLSASRNAIHASAILAELRLIQKNSKTQIFKSPFRNLQQICQCLQQNCLIVWFGARNIELSE